MGIFNTGKDSLHFSGSAPDFMLIPSTMAALKVMTQVLNFREETRNRHGHRGYNEDLALEKEIEHLLSLRNKNKKKVSWPCVTRTRKIYIQKT